MFVAGGDVNGDGFADIICGADAGGGPNITVFDGHHFNPDGTPVMLTSFFAFNKNFTGGVRVGAGDVNGDGKADIICGAGQGGGPNVTIFNGADSTNLLYSFFAYDAAFSAGIYVAGGDVNGDGFADVICGAGAGGGPNVTVFDPHNSPPKGVPVLASFNAFAAGFTGGVASPASTATATARPTLSPYPSGRRTQRPHLRRPDRPGHR